MLNSFKRWFVRVEARYGTGYTKLVIIKAFVELYLLLAIYMSTKGYNLPGWGYGLIFGTGVLGCYLIGWLWDKTHMFHYTKEFSNERDWFIQEMRDLKQSLKPLIKAKK